MTFGWTATHSPNILELWQGWRRVAVAMRISGGRCSWSAVVNGSLRHGVEDGLDQAKAAAEAALLDDDEMH